MVERRIVPDVSHCTRRARQQIYDLVDNKLPIVASHVGVRPLNDVEYNLDKEDVDAIVASRGVVGVIFMPYWLDAANPGELPAIWRTMKTLRDWTGSWDNVAIGTDFDGFTDPADDCKNSSELPKVRKLLEANGLAAAEVEAVLGGNARRVLRDAWR